MRVSHLFVGLALCVFVGTSGCEVKSNSKPANSAHDDHDHDGHDHDGHDHGKPSTGAKESADAHAGHDHSHDHGPNGGHIAHFEPSEAHFEWVHEDDAHKFIVHAEEIASAGGKIESMEVVVTSGAEVKKFSLKTDESAKIANSVFSLENAELLTLVGASGADEKGVQAKLIAVIDGKSQTCLLIDTHDHHH